MSDPPAAPNPPRRSRTPHTWPQRAVLVLNSMIVIGCLAAAVAVFYANVRISDRQVVTLETTTPPSATTQSVARP